MHTLVVPAIDYPQHLRACLAATNDGALAGRLIANQTALIEASRNYDEAAITSVLYSVECPPVVGPVTDKELWKTYDRTMAKSRARGRQVYEVLRHNSRGGICPLCAQRSVSTLDHYLPKKRFPFFAILPVNLVPACADCNKEKSSHTPTSEQDQLFHPYYDNLNGIKWLTAIPQFEQGWCKLVYRVDTPAGLDEVLAMRIRYHFDRLKLAVLYGLHGAAEMNMIRHRIRALHATGGPEQVREHLAREWESRSEIDRNSWQSATYEALANSPGFCEAPYPD